MSKVQQCKQLRASGRNALRMNKQIPGKLIGKAGANRISVATSGTTYLPIVGKAQNGLPILGAETQRQTRSWKPTNHGGRQFGLSTPVHHGNSSAKSGEDLKSS